MKAIYSKLFLFLQVSGILSYRINVFRYFRKTCPFPDSNNYKEKEKRKEPRKVEETTRLDRAYQ